MIFCYYKSKIKGRKCGYFIANKAKFLYNNINYINNLWSYCKFEVATHLL